MSATDQDVSRDRTADAESEAETETDGDNPPSVADLPPSAKLVYKVLEYEAR